MRSNQGAIDQQCSRSLFYELLSSLLGQQAKLFDAGRAHVVHNSGDKTIARTGVSLHKYFPVSAVGKAVSNSLRQLCRVDLFVAKEHVPFAIDCDQQSIVPVRI